MWLMLVSLVHVMCFYFFSLDLYVPNQLTIIFGDRRVMKENPV